MCVNEKYIIKIKFVIMACLIKKDCIKSILCKIHSYVSELSKLFYFLWMWVIILYLTDFCIP